MWPAFFNFDFVSLMSTHTVHEGSGVSRLFTVCLGNLNLPQQHFTNGLVPRYLWQ